MAETTSHPNRQGSAVERFRVGRKVGRTIYRQTSEDPSDADELVGVMDTRELAALAVAAMNGLDSSDEDGLEADFRRGFEAGEVNAALLVSEREALAYRAGWAGAVALMRNPTGADAAVSPIVWERSERGTDDT